MTLDTTVKQACERLLWMEKERLEGELGRIADPTETPGDYKTRLLDLGNQEGDSESEVGQYVNDLAVESALEQQLRDVMAALERVENGSYGVCAHCGRDIATERLLAYPAADACVDH
jgi:RNA polymerase-binding transcription factor DksA